MFAQAAEQFHAVHLRHLDVENSEVRRIFQQRLQGSFAIGIDARDETFCLEGDRNGRQDVAIVIDKSHDHLVALAAFHRFHLVHGRGPFCFARTGLAASC